MTEVSFYHLQREPLERALPKLLEKALERGMRVVVKAPTQDRVESLNGVLWTYRPDSFLPHGTAADGHSPEQPVYLTAKEENPNGATLLVLVDGAEAGDIGAYERCLDIFDGTDEKAVADARQRWQSVKAAGHDVTYWLQSPQGGWERKA